MFKLFKKNFKQSYYCPVNLIVQNQKLKKIFFRTISILLVANIFGSFVPMSNWFEFTADIYEVCDVDPEKESSKKELEDDVDKLHNTLEKALLVFAEKSAKSSLLAQQKTKSPYVTITAPPPDVII
jgi:hypothetical protein